MSGSDLTSAGSAKSCAESVRSRIRYKMRDYATYRFTAPQACAINIFFDLAQEFDQLEQIYLLSVLILRMFFQYEAELYLKDESDKPILVTPPVKHQDARSVSEIRSEIWHDDSHCYVPVYGKKAFVIIRNEPFATDEAPKGLLALHINHVPASHELLFLEKFANRVGFCLDTKMLALRNERHVLFLRKLAHDISHNIITPNMRLKLMLKQLENQIASLDDLAQNLPDKEFLGDIRALQQKMAEHAKAIMGTFKNSALFQESLLRQSHFDLGRYVLRRVKFDICKFVVIPQFERYRPSFIEKNLHVDAKQPSCPSAPCLVEADLGLISQVLANMLANAAKYSLPVSDEMPGEIRCTAELLPEGLKDGPPAVKVAVFSSGPHVAPEEAGHLFDDSYRASNATEQYGTGHGLFFVHEIIAEHGGMSGYEPAEGGNIFFFILPVIH